MEYACEGNETERKFYLRVARLVDKRFKVFFQNANYEYYAFPSKQTIGMEIKSTCGRSSYEQNFASFLAFVKNVASSWQVDSRLLSIKNSLCCRNASFFPRIERLFTHLLLMPISFHKDC